LPIVVENDGVVALRLAADESFDVVTSTASAAEAKRGMKTSRATARHRCMRLMMKVKVKVALSL
jgi:hypothetical protein